MFQSIKFKIWIGLAFLMALISTVCFFAAFADGGGGFMVRVLSKLFYVCAFPSFYILNFLGITDNSGLIIALIINSLLYGLLLERLLFRLRRWASKN